MTTTHGEAPAGHQSTTLWSRAPRWQDEGRKSTAQALRTAQGMRAPGADRLPDTSALGTSPTLHPHFNTFEIFPQHYAEISFPKKHPILHTSLKGVPSGGRQDSKEAAWSRPSACWESWESWEAQGTPGTHPKIHAADLGGPFSAGVAGLPLGPSHEPCCPRRSMQGL